MSVQTLDADGNLIVSTPEPAFQRKTNLHLDLEIRPRFVPWVCHGFAYKRDFGGAITLTFSKVLAGGSKVAVETRVLGAEPDSFFDLPVELKDGESVQFETYGGAIVGTHDVLLEWNERHRLVG
jgi:hypothetical protein